MSDSPEARCENDATDKSNSTDFLGTLLSWECPEVTSGLDQFSDVLPNLTPSQDVASPDLVPQKASGTDGGDKKKRGNGERWRRDMNKVAQQKFRERQKLSQDPRAW